MGKPVYQNPMCCVISFTEKSRKGKQVWSKAEQQLPGGGPWSRGEGGWVEFRGA